MWDARIGFALSMSRGTCGSEAWQPSSSRILDGGRALAHSLLQVVAHEALMGVHLAAHNTHTCGLVTNKTRVRRILQGLQ